MGPTPSPRFGSEPREAGSLWLSLRQAASEVGVHPATLRRWANEGRLASSRTIGGHRRFLRQDIQALIKERTRLRASGGIARAWAQKANAFIRRSRPSAIAPASFTWKDRERFRRSGQALLTLILEASDGQGEDHLRSEASCAGRMYADWARRRGVPADQLLGVLFRTRDAMIRAALDLAEAKGLEPQAMAGILRHVHQGLDAVELAILKASLEDRTPPGEARP